MFESDRLLIHFLRKKEKVSGMMNDITITSSGDDSMLRNWTRKRRAGDGQEGRGGERKISTQWRYLDKGHSNLHFPCPTYIRVSYTHQTSLQQSSFPNPTIRIRPGENQFSVCGATAFIAGLDAFQSYIFLFLLSIVLLTQWEFFSLLFARVPYCAIGDASPSLFPMQSMRIAILSRDRVSRLARRPSKSPFAVDTCVQNALNQPRSLQQIRAIPFLPSQQSPSSSRYTPPQ